MTTADTSIGLQKVKLAHIRPNSINPRGPNVRENDSHRENLKESVAAFGILVPLVVRPLDGDKFELIDGERRYWVAQSLKMEEVPAYVIDGNLDPDAILQRMFQIHMNRDQWDAVQQCKASEAKYAQLLAKHKGDIEAIIDEYAEFTGTDRRTGRNRIQFLRWPKDIKDKIYDDPAKHDSYWYVVEIEDKIVEPAQNNYPEYFERVKADDVRRFLYKKWESNTIDAAVDVRQAAIIARSQVKGVRQRKKALKILDRLVKDVDFSYEEAFNEFEREFAELVGPKLPKPRALLTSVHKLTDVLSQYEPQFLRTYRKNIPSIDDLNSAVRSLVAAGQSFLKRLAR